MEIKQLKVQSEDIHVNIICADRGYPKLSSMKEGLNGMAIPAKEKKRSNPGSRRKSFGEYYVLN